MSPARSNLITRRFVFALWSIITSFIAPVSAAEAPQPLALPDFGDSSETLLSPYDEQRLGEEFMRNVRHAVKIVDDPEVEEYIQSLGYRLIAGTDAPPFRFTFFVVQDPVINAFAGPGGYIGVHSGLIQAAQSESEVASVLAHEIAHVTQRHLLRAFDKASRTNLPATAALIAALILGGHNPQVTEAAIASTIAASQQTQINFTRANEAEADRVGLQILARAGYDPLNMPAFFEQLQQANRFYESGAPEFLRTHPVTTARIADTRNRAEQYPRVTPPDDFTYQLIRAKLQVLTAADPVQSVERYEVMLKQKTYVNEEAAQYGYGIALLTAGQAETAHEQFRRLLKKSPNRIAYLIASAQSAAAMGNGAAAIKTYSDALKLYPRHYPLTIFYARELLRQGQAPLARQLLQEYLRYRDPKPLLYSLLAQADSDAGFPVESQQSLAELDYLNGLTQGAIEHLNSALQLTDKNDFYRSTRIEARIKELKRQMELEKGNGTTKP